MSDFVFAIQQQLNQNNDQNFLSQAAYKIAQNYLPITLRLLQKNCRLLNIKCDDLAGRAWQEEVATEINKALQAYHSHQHYLSGRNLHAYLLASLRNFTKQRFWSQSGKRKYCVLICPACRFENKKNVLISENQLWRCTYCTEQLISASLAQKSFYSSFALHSRAGFLCPDCHNFIPRSLEKNGLLTCPFPNCCYYGFSKSLLRTTHPVMIMFRKQNLIDLNTGGKIEEEYNPLEKMLYDPNSSFSEDSFLLKDISEKEFCLLKEAIQSAMSFTERQNLQATKVQKTLFYRAFWDVTQEHSEEMISYLVHNKTNFDFALQATIFQKFLSHLEDFLPYSFVTTFGKKEICSLFDPHLGLFDGESSFHAIVQKDFSIANLTKEHYFSENLKDYGPYFFGKIIELKDESGKNLLPEMKGHSFVKIQLSENVAPGTKISVRHYRLVPHYTMGILIHLQKIRKHLGEILARKKKNWR